MVDQPVAIVQRLREMLSRVDEQHGGGTIDGGDEVQQHGGICTERGDDGDTASEELAQDGRENAGWRRVVEAAPKVDDMAGRRRHKCL